MPPPPSQPAANPAVVPGSDAWMRAAEALRPGGVALLPVEGGWMVVTAAGTAASNGLIDPAWLAPSVEAMATAFESLDPVAARLARRLAPGPLILSLDRPLHAPAPAGVMAARATSQPGTARVVAAVDRPLVGSELLDERGRLVFSVEAALAAAAKLAITVEPGAALSEAPVARQPATRLFMLGANRDPDGAVFRVVRPGGYEERFIRKQLGLNVLFVCTGNTCRSPMAEAIATALARTPGAQIDMKFGSAGTAAARGGPPSLDAVTAVKNLEIGATLGGHRSRPLSRKLIAEADVIYTMGRSHLHAILELDPEAEDKVRLLDPEGGDVPDPVGMSPEVYAQTARRIMAMLRQRLKELGS